MPSNDRLGSILSIRYLGQENPTGGGDYGSAVYYLTYYSGASGGSELGAKLSIPLGQPPAAGWPVSVFCHGFGDPAVDLRRWPLVGDDWRKSRGSHAGRWAHHGIATLTPWLPGAGPSEPYATYSPLSLENNFQAIADGFTALTHVEHELLNHPDLIHIDGIAPRLDFGRQVLRSDCLATPLLVYFAARWQSVSACAGLKALVADDFQPSVAYDLFYLGPYLCELPPKMASAMRALWVRQTWALATERGWPLTEFYSRRLIRLFTEETPTARGPVSRILGCRLAPPRQSELGPILLAAVTEDLGRAPTATEIRSWVLGDAMLEWASMRSLEEVIAAPIYQQYFAPSDPFFEETVTPFSPGLPLILVCRSGAAAVNIRGLPSFSDRYRNMTLPKIQRLRSWGWEIDELVPDRNLGTSFSGGSAQQWVMSRLAMIL